jgi:hypothetical protein
LGGRIAKHPHDPESIKQMLDQGCGHVVNVSTTLVDQADSSRPAALQTLTKGRPGHGHEIARDRVRLTWHTGKRRVAWRDQNGGT